jgi:DNA-binding MarR family transcriptional regulator
MRSISNPGQISDDAQRLHDLMIALGRFRTLRDPLADSVEELAFTAPQIHTLYWLGVEGPLPMGEVAGHCGITDKTITGVVDRLEREGYVQRVRDERDRRVVRVQLSKKGATTFRRFQTGLLQRLTRFLSMLEPADRSHLLQILERLLANVASRASGAEAPTKHAL